MEKQEVKNAIINQNTLIWNDPDPIEGNDYIVKNIWNIDNETAMIQYGSGEHDIPSEAMVLLSELSLTNKAALTPIKKIGILGQLSNMTKNKYSRKVISQRAEAISDEYFNNK